MPVLRSAIRINAPLPAVAAALRDVRVLQAPGRAGPRWEHDGLLGDGDEVDVLVRLAPGIRLALRLRAGPVALDRLRCTLVTGPVRRFAYTAALAGTAAGTLLTEELDWACPGGRAADVLVRRRVVRAVHQALHRHGERVRARAEQLAGAAEVVAAAVLLPDGRVLAQQRSRPAAMAGRWELPGGRVEPGESARDALVRECREELAVTVVPGAQLGPDVPLPGGRVLRVYRAALAEAGARPVPVEHAALRWVKAAELTGLDWLDADRIVLPDLELALRAGGGGETSAGSRSPAGGPLS